MEQYESRFGTINMLELVVALWLLAAVTGLAASQCPDACHCSANNQHVTCAGQGLRQVPNQLPPNTQALDLSRNNLSYISSYTFEKLTQLRQLDLSQNHLVNISVFSFASLTQLEVLLLDKNQLDETHLGFVDGMHLSSLRTLGLSNNAVCSLPDYWGEGVRTLKQLDLSGNCLTQLPKWSFRSKPKQLNASITNMFNQTGSTNVYEDNEGVSVLSELQELNLANNSILNITEDAFNGMLSLNKLDLSDNMLTTLHQQWFDNMTHLTFLAISNNPISIIYPHTFSTCSQLQEIQASGLNNLTRIYQHSFAGTSNLRVLNLSDSHSLSFIHPYSFYQMDQLEVLDIHNAGLEMLHFQTLNRNSTQLLLVNLAGNPWSCDCDLRWLKSQLLSNDSNVMFVNTHLVSCNSPSYLYQLPIIAVPHQNFSCYAPKILNSDKPTMFKLGSRAVLDCIVDGNPVPTITWITSHDWKFEHQATFWDSTDLDPESLKYHMNHHWHHTDIYMHDISHDNRIHVLENGSLYIDYITRNDAGIYVCIAKNYLGNDTVTIRLRLSYIIIKEVTLWSIFIGFLTAGGVLFIAIIVGAIRHLSHVCSKKDREQRKGIREVLEKMHDYRVNQFDKFSAYRTAKIDRISAFKTQKIDQISAYKSAKIGQLSAFKTAKIDKIRTYKQMTVTSVLQHMERTREHYHGQMARIRESCSQQAERLQDNYNTQTGRFKDYRCSQVDKVRENYQAQVMKVRDYGAQQLERLRDQYKMQQLHILKLLELLDIGNCMTVIEAECMRTESMLFDPNITFDLEAQPVHLPKEEDRASISEDAFYLTASSNSEHSSCEDIAQTPMLERDTPGEHSLMNLDETSLSRKKDSKKRKTSLNSEISSENLTEEYQEQQTMHRKKKEDPNTLTELLSTSFQDDMESNLGGSASDVQSSCYESASESQERSSISEATLVIPPSPTNSDTTSNSFSSVFEDINEMLDEYV